MGHEQSRRCDSFNDRWTECNALTLGQGISYLAGKPSNGSRSGGNTFDLSSTVSGSSGVFIGIALPAMLTIAFVPAGQEMDQWSAAGFQAEGLAEKGGRVMWYLTLLCGFWVLFSTQLGGVDGVPRTYTDIIWTGLKRARNLGESNAKWIYYPILGIYILWGIIAMYLAKPFFMILVSATIGGYLLVITGVTYALR